jgi:propane monooxygenase coupling protein
MTGAPREDMVGVSLTRSEEASAASAAITERDPSVTVRSRAGYFKIERAGSLEFDLKDIARHLGRELSAYEFLVIVSSFYGRIDVGDGIVRVVSDILPARFAEGQS